MGTMATRICYNCPEMMAMGLRHQHVCNCGHHHDDHVSMGGCKECKCERYDQTQLKVPGKPVKVKK